MAVLTCFLFYVPIVWENLFHIYLMIFFQLKFLDSRTYVLVAGRGTSVFSPLPLHLYLYVYVFVMCMRIHVTMLIGVIF